MHGSSLILTKISSCEQSFGEFSPLLTAPLNSAGTPLGFLLNVLKFQPKPSEGIT